MAKSPVARKRARAIFREHRRASTRRLDAILLHNGTEPHVDLSFFYVTGIPSGIFEGSSAVLSPDGRVHVITPPLEEESARQAKTGFELHVPRKRREDAKVLKTLVGPGRRTVGINASELTHAGFLWLEKTLPKANFVDVSAAIAKTRMIKDADEVAAIAKAARISSRVALAIPELLRDGVKESEVAAEIDYLGQRLGGSGPSFQTIAAFGPNAAEPHYTAGTARLRKGRFALFDYGTRYRRYCSDITRTFFYGRPSAKDRRMYQTVEAAQRSAFRLVKPGVSASKVHKAAQNVIDATEFKCTFIHGLGHGLGLAVHDGGSVSGPSKLVLRPGMVVTIEPGVYLPGYGGVRIEDDVLITKTGHRKLTTAPRGLVTV